MHSLSVKRRGFEIYSIYTFKKKKTVISTKGRKSKRTLNNITVVIFKDPEDNLKDINTYIYFLLKKKKNLIHSTLKKIIIVSLLPLKPNPD